MRIRRLFAVLAGVLALLVWSPLSAARAASLPDCLASHHVCVASDARGLVSQSQQAQLEHQIGNDDIYLVVANAGSAGYASAMDKIINALSANHDEYAVGFLDSGSKHFGAYNQGMLPDNGAANIATQVVRDHQADQNTFAAMEEFVRDVQQQAGPAAGGGSSGGTSTGSGQPRSYSSLIVLGVIALLVVGGYFGLMRPRRVRRQRELQQQLKEAKAAAQEDLLALNTAITDHGNDVTIASSTEAAAEQAAALDAYERGTQALDAARTPAQMGAVSRSIAEGRYRLACAEALAKGEPKPDRRPMCFFDPRHGMSVADVSWAPPDGRPARNVAACVDCQRVIERGGQPEMRLVENRAGQRVVYADAGFAPAYWGGFGYGGPMLAGFFLGEALSTPPVFGDWGYGGYGFDGAGFGGADFGGGDFGGGGPDFGGGDFGGGGIDFGGGDFGGGDFSGGGDFGGGGGDFGGGNF